MSAAPVLVLGKEGPLGVTFRAPEAAEPLEMGLSAPGVPQSSSAGWGSAPGLTRGGVGLPLCGMLILLSLPSSAADAILN